jgi:DNA-binding GntR family transcriptional regulator
VTAPVDVASRLNLDVEQGAKVVVRRYLLVIDGLPFQLADSYFDAALVSGTPVAGPENITPGRIDTELRKRFNLVPRRDKHVLVYPGTLPAPRETPSTATPPDD